MNTDKNTPSVKVLLSIAIPVVAFTVLGCVVGIFVGRSGHDSAVVAALIPAVLTLSGGFILLKNQNLHPKNQEPHPKNQDLHPAMSSFSVILFCVTLLFGASIGGASLREEIQQEKIDHFRRCSHEEQGINRFRVEMLDLSPLPSKTFCG